MASSYVKFSCFVRGLDQTTDKEDLKKIFTKFGNVVDSKIICDHVTGKSRGFGFVTFEEEKSMRDAIKEMNSHTRNRNKIGFQCFVHGLNCNTDAKILHSVFSVYGEVLDSQVIYDRETGSSRGFGFVTFKEEKSMRDAILFMDGGEIDDGDQIHVEESRSKNVTVRSITVEEARPRRCKHDEFVKEFLRMIIEKEMDG